MSSSAATDCLSEGINLQEHFDAVAHYDLPWNPNRLEQREGRVDRYGQPRTDVKAVLIWGENNQVDQVVLDVLINKAHRIRRTLGVSVPVPVDAEQVVQPIGDNVLLRGTGAPQQLELGLTGENVSRLHAHWDQAAEREKDQRAYFAHEGIQPDTVHWRLRRQALKSRVFSPCEQYVRFAFDMIDSAPSIWFPKADRDQLREKRETTF